MRRLSNGLYRVKMSGFTAGAGKSCGTKGPLQAITLKYNRYGLTVKITACWLKPALPAPSAIQATGYVFTVNYPMIQKLNTKPETLKPKDMKKGDL